MTARCPGPGPDIADLPGGISVDLPCAQCGVYGAGDEDDEGEEVCA